jgi:hypothetical protein
MLPGGQIIAQWFDLAKVSDITKNTGLDMTDVIQLNWDGKPLWNFNGWDTGSGGTTRAREHHDFERQGNPVGYYAPGQNFVPRGTTLFLAHKERNRPDISRIELIDKETVWYYITPSNNEATLPDSIYRAYRVPPEWLPEGVNPGGYAFWGN